MWVFVRRMGMRLQKPEDIDWVRRGLAIAAIEGGRMDYRDTITSLVLLRHGAERLGIAVDPLFRQIQQPEYLAPENKPLFENARTHSADNVAVTVRAFGPKIWVAELNQKPGSK
jgi:hypothetical protein